MYKKIHIFLFATRNPKSCIQASAKRTFLNIVIQCTIFSPLLSLEGNNYITFKNAQSIFSLTQYEMDSLVCMHFLSIGKNNYWKIQVRSAQWQLRPYTAKITWICLGEAVASCISFTLIAADCEISKLSAISVYHALLWHHNVAPLNTKIYISDTKCRPTASAMGIIARMCYLSLARV